MVKSYSLADYDFTITSVALPGQTDLEDNFEFTLGGAGNFLDSVTVTWDSNVFEKEADPLGNVVFTKSYARDGQISLSINMLSDKVKIFNKIMQLYYGGGIKDRSYSNIKDPFFSITIKRHGVDSASVPTLIEASYCALQKLPDLEFGQNAGTREFVFLAAEIGAPDVETNQYNKEYSFRELYDSPVTTEASTEASTDEATEDSTETTEEGGE